MNHFPSYQRKVSLVCQSSGVRTSLWPSYTPCGARHQRKAMDGPFGLDPMTSAEFLLQV